MLISVVLPIYNVEKYLRRCLDSIVNQTYKNLEILLVNDGSTDNCLKICEEYAKSDNRIKVINKKNAGLGMARNTGIDNARGEYICFFDSNDYIELDTIEKAYQIIVSENVEIVCFGFNKVNTKGKIVEKNIPRMGKNVFKNSEIILDFLPNLISENPKTGKSSNLNMSAWAAVYSMKLIKENNWKFVSEREIISEDVYSLLNLYRNVKKVAILEEALYYYCENNTSLTKVYRKDRYERIEYCYKRCAELCKKIGYPVEIESRIIYPYIGNTIAALKQIVGSNNNFEEKINELKKIIYSNTLQQVLRIAKNNKVNMSKKILFFCIRKKMIKLMYLLIYIKQRVKNYEN